MKINKIYLSVTAIAMMFASCGNEDLELGNSTTAPVDANCPAVEFAANNATTYEVDPADPSFTVTVQRKATDAATYNIKVVENQDNSFVVPATVEFAADETTKDINISMNASAAAGEPLALTLSFDDADLNPYTTGLKSLSINTTIIKWESIGTGYWLGNIVNQFYGVEVLPLAVEIEKAVTASAIKFRFVCPYASVCTEQDELGGYVGYPYNDEAKLTGNVEKAVITITKSGASLAPVSLGIDYGYGEMSMGSVYGYLSEKIDKYPLGTYTQTETGGIIEFPANSLYISDNDGAVPCSKGPTILYLSAQDFMAASEE